MSEDTLNEKLYKVSVRLSADGFSETVYEYDILKEGAKTYYIERKDKWDEVTRRYKKKEQIGKVTESVWINSITNIAYQAWCFQSEIDMFKVKCKEMVINTAKIYQNTFNKLISHLN